MWALLLFVKTTLDGLAGPEVAAQPGGWQITALCSREVPNARLYPHFHLTLHFSPDGRGIALGLVQEMGAE